MRGTGTDNQDGTAAADQWGRVLHPCFICFDMVFLNGQLWADRPLGERRAELERGAVFTPPDPATDPGDVRLLIGEATVIRELRELTLEAEKSVHARQEGILIKNRGMPYGVNGRAGKGWWKWKPEYIDVLSDTLDVLVIGGIYGKGSRGEWVARHANPGFTACGAVTSFLVGLADAIDPTTNRTRWLTFATVGGGYSDKDLAELDKLLGDKWHHVDSAIDRSRYCGPDVLHCKSSKVVPDVWIEPEQSVVLEVKAAEMVPADNVFAAGLTLRYGRAVRLRTDKSWRDAATYREVRELFATQGNKMTSLSKGRSVLVTGKQTAGGTAARRSSAVAGGYAPAVLSEKQRASASGMLRGYQFCLAAIPGDTTWATTKQALEKTIQEHGGTVVANLAGDREYTLANR